jgi:hypothetical protein
MLKEIKSYTSTFETTFSTITVFLTILVFLNFFYFIRYPAFEIEEQIKLSKNLIALLPVFKYDTPQPKMIK